MEVWMNGSMDELEFYWTWDEWRMN